MSLQTPRITTPIAVVGLGCHYPGADELSALWENILARRCQFRQMPDRRLPLSDYYDSDRNAPDQTYGSQASVIDGFEFDWVKRRVPQSTVASTDIVHWLALEVALKAIENAGYKRESVPTHKSGVILGNTLTGEHTRSNTMRLRWPFVKKVLYAAATAKGLPPQAIEELSQTMEQFYKSVFPKITEDSLAGGLSNTIGGRICNFFNFDGGGYTVDAACSSSLIAIATAATSLANGDLDMALAGGVDISLDTFELIGFAKTGALTAEDMTVYDRRGSGFIPGEGCGFVVLKRLEDACAAGDYIYAVINGWGISSDGKGGITAPSRTGQAKALGRAYEKAGYSLRQLHFIEGHGTGTPVGDRTELAGVALAMGADGEAKPRSCGMTSFKSIVGHTKAAAGIGGFIKAVMAVNQRILPPTANCEQPNPVFDEVAKCLYPILQGEIYDPTETLYAGVSAMGFGGINSHVTISSGDAPAVSLKPSLDERALLVSHQDTEVFVLSGASVAALLERIQLVSQQAEGISLAELVDLAAELSSQVNLEFPWRVAIVAGTPKDLLESLKQLEQLLNDRPPAPNEIRVTQQQNIWLSNQVKRSRVGFLFPGQGSQRLNMARTLVQRYSWAREFLEQSDLWLEEIGFSPISEYIYRPLDRAVNTEQVQNWFQELTEVAPTAICFVSLLWKRYLERLGIKPVAVGGHSLGELVAFHLAGAYDEKTLLKFAAMRGELMTAQTILAGNMASLGCDRQTAQRLLSGIPGYLAVANINSPVQTVISGEKTSVELLLKRAATQNIQTRQLAVANGFHSQMMAQAAEHLRSNAPIPEKLEPPNVPLFSCVNGQLMESGVNLKEHFASQVTAQVNFIDLVQAIAPQCDIMLEVGPGKVLSGLVSAITDSSLCLPLESKAGKAKDLNRVLASFFAHGGQINWSTVYENRLVRPFIPASQRLFIDNPCERPFSVSAEYLSPMNLSLSGDREQELESNTPFNDHAIAEILSNYFVERGSFLADLIRADLENFPPSL
ncbi:MAG: type I polyketide synthase [Okeania sp. SIO3H1]|uniref:type I polyketide synthase n=1 Tax=Okeania sp. SIO1I7 TaxID=2607772 RepID=UPI0013CBD535|nr:type I polyketide synthase [Okeania sp. SIO1I7]NEN89392.1 type I polyketide synthase [Okeania sp. SIO3H1]NET25025.1 type I polyketide synthase [Okeania sp. SIO1I7]